MRKVKNKSKRTNLDCPYKEMKWCLDRNIRIYAERYAEEVNGVWKEGNFYRITAEQGDRVGSSDWVYTNDTIATELIKAWIKTYQINNGKEK
jgi:hypothetical protein